MATESEAPQSNETPESGVPPEAFDRVKKERDDATQRLAQAAPALKAAALIDQLHGHFKAQEKYKGQDYYEMAKTAAGQGEVVEAEDPAQAAEVWIDRIAGLFQKPAAAQTQAAPLIGGQPNPSAPGVPADEGPHKVASKEYKEFLGRHGPDATNEAIRQGLFFYDPEVIAAQETIGGL